MPTSEFTKRVQATTVKARSSPWMLRELLLEGFFDQPVTSAEVVRRIGEKFSRRWTTSVVQPNATRLIREGLMQAVKIDSIPENYWASADIPRKEAVAMIGKGRKLVELEAQLFSDGLKAQLQRDFHQELDELHDNFGKNGTCTAFLLRKILEKLLLIVFGKLDLLKSVEDTTRPGGWKGLEAMLDTATREKANGLPLLTGKTSDAVKGMKFLGDKAAHNPFVNVDMSTIIPQLPYIVTAYEELARFL